MTDDSELVVTGTVTRTWTDWDPGHKYIWTHYELAVSATEKGAPGRTVDIAEPGGEMDGIAMTIAGGAGYRVGESVLVFLSRMPNGYLRTAGFGMGKYLVDSTGRVHGAATFQTAAADTKSAAADTKDAAADTKDTAADTKDTAAIRSLDGMQLDRVAQLVSARVHARGGNTR